jgi:hypothetical protein
MVGVGSLISFRISAFVAVAGLFVVQGCVPAVAASPCEEHKQADDSCLREGVYKCSPPKGGKCYTTTSPGKFNCECFLHRPPGRVKPVPQSSGRD